MKIYNSTPYILYSNSDTGLLYLKKYENDEWIEIGKGPISDDHVNFSGLAFCENGVPYVIYVDAAHGEQVNVLNYINEEWAPAGEKGISAGKASYACIDCYNKEPYIAYSDAIAGEKLKVMKFEY